jgi:hypothetical protein
MKYKKFLDLILKTFITGNEKINIITKYSEIEELINSKNPRKYEYLYHYKTAIHNILYDKEKIIKIPSNIKEIKFANLFYLILLIKDNPCITNYIYNFEFINNVNNYRKNNNNNIFISFILSMIIIELIENYKNAQDFYDDNYEDILDEIINENQKEVKNNYIDFNKNNFGLEQKEVKLNSLEEIYSKIVISLISKEKLEDYEFSNNILNQLVFDKINITEKIFQNLFLIFNNNNIKKYNISKIDDLNDEKKINFYYILFKFIFKNPFYIYNIPFLLNIKRQL